MAEQVIAWTWKIKVSLHLETELMASLREKAEEEAIDVFARNLTALLMAAPAGAKTLWAWTRACVRELKSRW